MRAKPGIPCHSSLQAEVKTARAIARAVLRFALLETYYTFMRKPAFKFLIAASVLACGDDPVCIIQPCPFPVAILMSVHTTSSQSGIAGAYVRVAGMGEIPCASGSAPQCLVSGLAATYQLDIGAPGFQTVHRTVEVTGQGTYGCGTCPSVDTQQLDIVLVPVT